MYTRDTTLPPLATGSNSFFAPTPPIPKGGTKAHYLGLSRQVAPGLMLDLALLSIALLAMLFRVPLAADRHNLQEVLRLRISLINLVMGGTCIALWAILLRLTSPTKRESTKLRFVVYLGLQVAACTCLAAAFLFLRHPELANFSNLGIFFLSSFILLFISRYALGAYRTVVEPAIRKQRSVIIVGSGRRGQRVASRLPQHPKWNYQFLGFVDSADFLSGDSVLGTFEALEAILMTNPIDEVIITLPVKSMYDDIQRAISTCERLGIQAGYSTDLFATEITKTRSIDSHDPSSTTLHMVNTDVRRYIKRIADVVIAGVGLICLLPVFTVIAVGITCTSKGPILFRQQRYGLNKRIFTLYKFRSMVVDAECLQNSLEHLNETSGPVFKIRRDPRITGVGDFLRKTSLDELPQLWNVLVGDMSLVGPRPLPMRDVSRFSEAWLMRRFSVLPGITGLWQVSGRSNTSFARWIRLDLDYIDHWSLLLDIKILVKTFPAVLRREGAA